MKLVLAVHGCKWENTLNTVFAIAVTKEKVEISTFIIEIIFS